MLTLKTSLKYSITNEARVEGVPSWVIRWSPENTYHYQDYISEQRPESWDDPGSLPHFAQRVSGVEVQLNQPK